MRIAYPWPSATLSPNSRAHWTAKSKAARELKNESWALTKQAGLNVDITKPLMLLIVFRPPTNTKRDLDNTLARCKYLLDGVALAIGMDDSNFELNIKFGDVIKCGAVEIEFKQGMK